MARTKHTVILLMYWLTFGAGWSCADTGVRGLFMVSADASLLGSGGGNVLTALATSSSVLGKAAVSVYGEEAGQTFQSLDCTPLDKIPRETFMLSFTFGKRPEGQATLGQKFLEQMAENFQQALLGLYAETRGHLQQTLAEAQQREAEAKAKLAALSNPTGVSQTLPVLGERVYLSSWHAETTFGDAVDSLRQQVDLPAGLTVLWRELDREGVDVEDLIGLEGLGDVSLATALDLLLRSLSADCEHKLGYSIQDGAIVIALAQATPVTENAIGASSNDLAAQRRDMDRQRQDVEMDLTQIDAQCRAIEEQIAQLRRQMTAQADQDTLNQDLEELLRALQQRRVFLEKAKEGGRANNDDLIAVMQQLAETKMKMAERQMEFLRQHGGDLLRELSGRLVELTIERAKFQAQFEQLASRIGKLDVQLTSASQYEVLRMSRELALQSLKEAMMEAHALTQQYERLSPPSVSLVKAGQ